MDISAKILSDITVFAKYARYLEKKKRRETWDEVVTRNRDMHIKKYPKLRDEIVKAFELVYDKKVLPSMRGMQFGGKPVEIMPNRQYNCAFLPIDDPFAFAEIMFLLLGGTGCGYSVQYHHINKLPEIRKPVKRKRRHLIADSIEGWADSIRVLMKAYFLGLSSPVFDYSDIRLKGTPLKTSGGIAPGPQPLHTCIHKIKSILDAKEDGTKLTPLEVHDIICHIADAVLAGGIRRAALISLFSLDDIEMKTCKFGNWFEENAQRGRANNSAIILRHRIKEDEFLDLWKTIQQSGSGEPGIYFSNDMELGTNPCCEVALRAFQFCNLTTINGATIVDQRDFNHRARVASFIGTLQAGYTDFHYLRDIWRETTEKDALIGVSITGVVDGPVMELDRRQAAQVIVSENLRVANLIGINPAARTTVMKPEGTSSNVLGGVSNGVHGRHDKYYYIRRMELLKNEPIYLYLKDKIPLLIEDDFSKPHLQAKLSIPIKCPENTISREESALSLLTRVKNISTDWIRPGHTKGDNTNNVSATISVREHEWDEVGKWMWDNRYYYNGLAVLPFDGGNYTQTPYESCDEATYEKLLSSLKEINLIEVTEDRDNTRLRETVACAGGQCEI